MRYALQGDLARPIPRHQLSHCEWVEKVAILCSTLLDERQWAYDRTVRAIEAIYGPCPPKK
jgi:hypothetical protein